MAKAGHNRNILYPAPRLFKIEPDSSNLTQQTLQPHRLGLPLSRIERRSGQPRMWKVKGLYNLFKFQWNPSKGWKSHFEGLFGHQIWLEKNLIWKNSDKKPYIC